MAGGEIIVEGEGELAGGSGFGAMFDRDTSAVADHLVTPTRKYRTENKKGGVSVKLTFAYHDRKPSFSCEKLWGDDPKPRR